MKDTGRAHPKKDVFTTLKSVKEVDERFQAYLSLVTRVKVGILDEAAIAMLPNDLGELSIDAFKIGDIIRKHGYFPLENFIITANEPTAVMTGVVDKKNFVTLVFETDSELGFVISSRKFNGHYVVTFFEPSDKKYIKSVKRRGTLLFDKKKTP